MATPTLESRSAADVTLPDGVPSPTSDVANVGEWRPRTRDLAEELPVLLDAVWAAGYDTFRVIFNLESWDDAPRHLTVDGREVKCGGFRTQGADTLDLLDAWGRHRLTLAVVRPADGS